MGGDSKRPERLWRKACRHLQNEGTEVEEGSYRVSGTEHPTHAEVSVLTGWLAGMIRRGLHTLSTY